MQKELLGIAVICVCIFAFFVVVAMPPVSAAFSSVDIIAQTPTVLHPGDTRTVILTVKNIGDRDIRDVRLEFQVAGKRNVSLVGDTVYQIPTLNSRREKKVNLKSVHVEESTPAGIYNLPIHCYWVECYTDPVFGYVCKPNEIVYVTDPNGNYYPVTRNPVKMGISFIVKGDAKVTTGNVYTKPTHIRSGDENVMIAVEIVNSGEAAAKDMVVKLICNNQFVSGGTGADRSYIAVLNAGKKVVAPFHVDIADDVEVGVYNIPLLITYRDTGNREYVLNKSMKLVVEGKPELDIYSYYTDPMNLSAGDSAVLHVKVRNVGSEQAESVSVRVTETADTPFNFSTSSDYVGNLKANTAGTAVLKFKVDANATNNVYPQGLELICRGDLGSGNYTFNDKIQLEVFSVMSNTSNMSVTPEAPSPSAPGFDALLAFVALFVISVFLLCREREK